MNQSNSGRQGHSQGNCNCSQTSQGQAPQNSGPTLSSYERSVANLFPGARIVKDGQTVRRPQ